MIAKEVINKALKKHKNKLASRAIQSKLTRLNPGIEGEQLLLKFLTEKVMLEVLVIVVAVLLICMASFSQKMNSKIGEDGKINRPLHNSKVEQKLIANIEDEDIPIEIVIPEKELSDIEINDAYKELCNDLETIILARNDSIEHITENLYLPAQIEGYPFMFQWISDRHELMNDKGEINEEIVSEDGEKVTLICQILYKKSEFEKRFDLTIYPREMTEDEYIKREIIASILLKQNETKYKKYLQLPLSIGEKEISWKESSSYTVLILAILTCVAVIGIWWGVDNDLTRKCEKRDQLLRLDYSEFVSKLQLLISSGMTIRGALERMEADYKYSNKEKYVYEELSICLKRLRDGASEISVYQMFGNRCGLLCYKKLVSLLIQNINKGTDDLVNALYYESKAAFEERKHFARRLGEEAQVKLLFPMILMLGIVMVIILVPAYFSFGV